MTTTTTQLVAELRALLDLPADADPDEVVLATGSAAGFLQATLRVTGNPTVLEAGYKHNVIPDTASALIDLRPFAGMEDEVLARVRELVGPGIGIEVLHRDPGLEFSFDGALVERMTAALHRHDPGAPVLPYLMSGGTDNKSLSELGITGYGFAPLRLTPDLDFPAVLADDLLPERAFAGDPLARSALINRIYKPLQEHSSDLLTTLWAYLDNGRSLEGTARELFVHPNTVRYRLKRISEIIGYDATGAREALILQASLIVGSISGRKA